MASSGREPLRGFHAKSELGGATSRSVSYRLPSTIRHATSREVWPSGIHSCSSGPPSPQEAARKQFNTNDFFNYWCGQ